VHFWSNHFAVSIDKIAVLGLAGPLETEAIRPNVLGNFRDLLSAVERHPAMLVYLDNHISAGPNSRRRNSSRVVDSIEKWASTKTSAAKFSNSTRWASTVATHSKT
jgi:uncharacterized protein (DUF1800 family)